MANDQNRDLPHIYLSGHGESISYTAHPSGGSGAENLPSRNRIAHADTLTRSLAEAVTAGEAILRTRDERLRGGTPGFYLEFELPENQADVIDRLERRSKTFPIEVASVRATQPGKLAATIFVPENQQDYYLNKIAAYRNENGKPNSQGVSRPRNEPLVASIDTVRLAVARSLYTDEPDRFPAPGVKVWWEIWLRKDFGSAFESATQILRLQRRDDRLTFPDRTVELVCASAEEIGQLFTNTSAIAELRLARDTPEFFLAMEGGEQRLWSEDLANRIVRPPIDAPAVCLLDSGTTLRHPLIACGLTPADQQAYDHRWSPEDISIQPHGGHGTELSGIALHGDLMGALTHNEPLELRHRLESVKILPDHGANDPKLYGAITAQAIAAAEIVAPFRSRAICLAITCPGDHWRGRPSSWSAELDKIAFGDESISRLMIVSAGNIRETLKPGEYPDRNDVSPIENPAQAWNVLTVGAYSEQNLITGAAAYAGWQAFAPMGDLTPTSRTSVSWNHDWPLKPDIVLEGGNLGVDPSTGKGDHLDDLALLTTFRRPEERPFTTTGHTSAATALAARLAARILAERPTLWPETVRGLIVHSAEWTEAMMSNLGGIDKRTFLRRYGFGVPSIHRALHSLENDVTMVIENDMQPFRKKTSEIGTNDMVLHNLPWPKTLLERLGSADVEMRVTLSYFIEPNPGERGRTKRHAYSSHGLRFAVKHSTDSPEMFRRRINAEDGTRPIVSPRDGNWVLGSQLRNRGSLRADIWKGSAADLADRDAIVVYPTGGWWRENPVHERWDSSVRYSLIVSLRTAERVSLYSAIQTEITPEVMIET
jgi:hypothetical protein